MSGRVPVISSLRQRPEFFDTVVDRIWNAWGQQRGHSIERVSGPLCEHLNSASIPFTLVAHEGPQFAGNALVIVSDMEERPQYTPWVAAVWVDPAYRMQGIGGALVDQATTFAFALGINRIYLCATRENRGFYLKRGWVQVEEDIGDSLLTVMIREPVD